MPATNLDVVLKLGLDKSLFDRAFAKSTNDVKGSLREVGREVGNVANRLATVGLAAASIFTGLAIKSSIEYAKSVDTIRANMDGTVPSAVELRDTLRKLSTELVFNTRGSKELASAYAAIADEGLGLEGSLKVVRTSTELAFLANTDLVRTTVAVEDALSAWGLEAREAARAGDVLWAVSRKTGTGLEELLTGMKTIGPQAVALGLSFEEAAALVGTLRDAGVEGARGLVAAFNEIQTEGTAANELLRELGVTLSDETGPKSFVQLLVEIRSELEASGLSSSEVQARFAEAFGSEGVLKVIEAATRGTEEFAATQAAAATAAGFVATELKKRAEDESVTIAQNRVKYEELRDTIGNQLLPTYIGVLEVVGRVIGVFQKLEPVTQGYIFVGGVATLVTVKMVVSLVSLTKAAIAAWPAIVAGATALWGWVAPLVAAAIAAWPVTLAVIAITAAIVAGFIVWRKWGDEITAFVRDVWDRFVAALERGVAFFLEIPGKLAGLGEKIADALLPKWLEDRVDGFFRKLDDKTKAADEKAGALREKADDRDQAREERKSDGGSSSSPDTGSDFEKKEAKLKKKIAKLDERIDEEDDPDKRKKLKEKRKALKKELKELRQANRSPARDNVLTSDEQRDREYDEAHQGPPAGPVSDAHHLERAADIIARGGRIGLAKGGIVTRATRAIIGEGGEAEAVIPLSKLGKVLKGLPGGRRGARDMEHDRVGDHRWVPPGSTPAPTGTTVRPERGLTIHIGTIHVRDGADLMKRLKGWGVHHRA